MEKFYVTTPIYYVNDIPHIGHAYTTIAADVLARYWRTKLGEENVFFLTGTDEHGAKVAQAAKDAGQQPQEFVDSIAPQFEKAWQELQISYDHFFRTTDPRHEREVSDILQKLYDKKYVYEGIYEGLYCEGCEKFLTEEDLVDGKCPLHPNREPQHKKERNYFFRLSAFKKDLLEIFKTEQVKILPVHRKNEILGKLAGELKDVSISREGVGWGIPIPWDKSSTCYVWIEALLNYYTATRFLAGKKEFWPADVHLMAKDILWFHTVIWCALLLAAELPLPRVVFAHGFFTINGQKMSKSLGNVIAPKELVEKFGVDATRYLLVSEFPFGQDGDFSLEKLKIRYNSELANNLGNLIARVAKLCENVGLSAPESPHNKFDEQVTDYLETYQFNLALQTIWSWVDGLNKKIDSEKLWENTAEKQGILIEIVGGLRKIAFNLKPFLPETAERIEDQFRGPKISAAQPLFPRI